MICQKCGAVIADGTLICPECGGRASYSPSGNSEGAPEIGRSLSTYEIQNVRKQVLSLPFVLAGLVAYSLCLLLLPFGVAALATSSDLVVSFGETAIIFAQSLTLVIPGVLIALGLWKICLSVRNSEPDEADLSGAQFFGISIIAQIVFTVIAVIIAIAAFASFSDDDFAPIISACIAFLDGILILAKLLFNKFAGWVLSGAEECEADENDRDPKSALAKMIAFGPVAFVSGLSEPVKGSSVFSMACGVLFALIGVITVFVNAVFGIAFIAAGVAYFCYGFTVMSYKNGLVNAYNSAPVYKKDKPSGPRYHSHAEVVAAAEAERANSIICKKCGAKNELDSDFCITCGERLEKPEPAKNLCPSCGAEVSPDSAFCPSCGQKL